MGAGIDGERRGCAMNENRSVGSNDGAVLLSTKPKFAAVDGDSIAAEQIGFAQSAARVEGSALAVEEVFAALAEGNRRAGGDAADRITADRNAVVIARNGVLIIIESDQTVGGDDGSAVVIGEDAVEPAIADDGMPFRYHNGVAALEAVAHQRNIAAVC